MPERLPPCGEKTAERHGCGAEDEGPRSDVEILAGERKLGSGCGEDEVKKPEAEEGDVAEAGETPPVRRIASHPFLVVEEEAEDGAGENSSEHTEPAGDEVEGLRMRSHARVHACGRGAVGKAGSG